MPSSQDASEAQRAPTGQDAIDQRGEPGEHRAGGRRARPDREVPSCQDCVNIPENTKWPRGHRPVRKAPRSQQEVKQPVECRPARQALTTDQPGDFDQPGTPSRARWSPNGQNDATSPRISLGYGQGDIKSRAWCLEVHRLAIGTPI